MIRTWTLTVHHVVLDDGYPIVEETLGHSTATEYADPQSASNEKETSRRHSLPKSPSLHVRLPMHCNLTKPHQDQSHFSTCPTYLSLLLPLKHSNTHTNTFKNANAVATQVKAINLLPLCACTPISLPCLLTTELALTATAVVIADAIAMVRKARNHKEISRKADRRPLKKKESSDAEVATRRRPAAMQ